MVQYRDAQGKNVEYMRGDGQLHYGKDVPFLSTLGAFVVPNDPEAADDGNLSTPYLTIQAAVEDLESLAAPPAGIRRPVFIAPGVYVETVYITGAIALVGMGGRGLVQIAPPDTYPAIAAADATRASLEAWIAAGAAAYLANLGVLVQGATVPDVHVVGIELFATNAPALAAAGVVGLPFIRFDLCELGDTEAVWASTSYIKFEDTGDNFAEGDVELHNACQFFGIRSNMGDIEANDTSTVNLLYCGARDYIGNDSSEFGTDAAAGRSKEVTFGNQIRVNDLSIFHCTGGSCRTTMFVGGGATSELIDFHVQGQATYENAAPLQACTADGGAFTLAFIDAGARLTRIVGF